MRGLLDWKKKILRCGWRREEQTVRVGNYDQQLGWHVFVLLNFSCLDSCFADSLVDQCFKRILVALEYVLSISITKLHIRTIVVQGYYISKANNSTQP